MILILLLKFWYFMFFVFLGFTWRHKFYWGSTLNRYTVIGLKKISLYVLTLCLAANMCNFVRFACSSTIQSSIHFGLTPTQNYWKRFQWNPRIENWKIHIALQQYFSNRIIKIKIRDNRIYATKSLQNGQGIFSLLYGRA